LMAWLRKRVFSVGVVFSLGFLVVISTLAGTAVEVAFRDLPLLLPVAGNTVMMLVYTCAFALMYHYLPDRRVHWKQAFLGGLITAALFLVGRWAIAFYLAEARSEEHTSEFQSREKLVCRLLLDKNKHVIVMYTCGGVW